MEKVIHIDGRDVRFKATAAVPMRYKAQFGKDYFSEILKLSDLKGSKDKVLKEIDFDVFYNIAWTMAKTADKSIGDPLSWLDEFEEFPIIEILPELQDMIVKTLQSKKK
ncbi:hypothetical protein [Cytobacillus sp. IB215316]|uniref:hypothetical protein n=1 Tax=Cytobacillus sp. IB215316 TaxID=3097354 RepID=UPI002A0C8E6B|nr:hypothetical protein [Cytobacillus sp. IB215316]MDX8359827.1 hypothetical protein [Cytobacillus sp. IB215316]